MITKRLGSTDVLIPAIGQGTMGIGGYFTPDRSNDAFFIETLRKGISEGMSLLDTAEAYGGGHSEEVIGMAVEPFRHNVFIASKVSPEHLSYRDVLEASLRSRQRLRTEYIDLYQVHWPNPAVPISETMQALMQLKKEGAIRYIGVCNFSLKQIERARTYGDVDAVQMEYNLFDRSIEKDLIPYCTAHGITLLAYSPLDHGIMPPWGIVRQLADQYHKTISQVVLKWIISHPGVIAIPKSANVDHVMENANAVTCSLLDDDIDQINAACVAAYAELDVSCVVTDRNIDAFVPSCEVLAGYFTVDDYIKPIKVKKAGDTYLLTEGKLRYWAWRMAFNDRRPVPALIRNNLR